MRRTGLFVMLSLLLYSVANSQIAGTERYSESENNGVVIQNSFPKGGPYPWPTDTHFGYSYLVFYTRVANESSEPIELDLNLSADSVAIPNSPNTYMKLFLPPDVMTPDKRSLFSYGMSELESFDKPTSFRKDLQPGEDCLFYVVALFYQTKADIGHQSRGGNRIELVMNGEDLFYRMPPQIDSLHCGNIRKVK